MLIYFQATENGSANILVITIVVRLVNDTDDVITESFCAYSRTTNTIEKSTSVYTAPIAAPDTGLVVGISILAVIVALMAVALVFVIVKLRHMQTLKNGAENIYDTPREIVERRYASINDVQIQRANSEYVDINNGLDNHAMTTNTDDVTHIDNDNPLKYSASSKSNQSDLYMDVLP